jgi:putative two-component system response regulator
MQLTVVIVDDNPLNIKLLEALVAQLDGIHSISFSDPELALQWCLQESPDLILLDYMMPALDGLTFIKVLRDVPSRADVPILMLTASHETDTRYEALALGANDFMTKPIDRIEFLARSRNMLALRRAQRQLADRAAWLADEVHKATRQIAEREQDTIFRLTRAAEYRDPDTGSHVVRMAHYARLIGAQLGLPDSELDLLLRAAPMHDIGKVGSPDHILRKQGKLSEPEWAIMREHARIGHEILRDSPSQLLQMAAQIAHCHHEKFDGSGYPNGLIGLAIPLVARIVAVADVFDALTCARPYKPAWPLEQARDFLVSASGSHFDPACVRAFVDDWEGVLAIRAQY